MKKFTKILALVLTVLMIASVFAACKKDVGDTTIPTDTTPTPTPEPTPDPTPEGKVVKIANQEGFDQLVAQLNDNPEASKGVTYKLFSDINYAATWEASPTQAFGKLVAPEAITAFPGIKEFYGTFDGNGKTISAVYRVGADGATAVGGFIDKLNGGTVKNLTINTGYIFDANGATVGGLVGTVNGNGASIENVTVNVSIYAANDGAAAVGGVVGAVEADGFTMTNTTFGGKVGNVGADLTIPSASTTATVAQLIGNAADKAVTLTECAANGDVICNDGATKNTYANGSAVTNNNCTTTPCANPGVVEISEYKIYTAEELLAVSTYKSDWNGKTITLMNDIDLNPEWNASASVNADTNVVTLPVAPTNVWTPIPVFKGTFNGNGQIISGLYSATDFAYTEGKLHLGGFINTIEGGTIKNLIVKNSLSVFNGTGSGSDNIRIGGFVGRLVDATVEVVFTDMDSWVKFSDEYCFGGMICEIDTVQADRVYEGKVENLVHVGTSGRICSDGTWNKSEGSVSNDGRVAFGGMIGPNRSAISAETKVAITMQNLSFIGTFYTPEMASGKQGSDSLLCYTGKAERYSYGIALNNCTEYNVKNGTVTKTDKAMTDAAEDIKNLESNVNETDTYAATGWKLYLIENGAAQNTDIILPGAVVDMLSAKGSIEPDTTWYVEGQNAFTISNAAQLLGLSELAQHVYEEDGKTVKTLGKDFAGVTITIGSDIDLNPYWDATTVVSAEYNVALAGTPLNLWKPIPVFKGKIVGGGHTISGLYSSTTFEAPLGDDSTPIYMGGFITELISGEITNLIFDNGLAYFTSETEGASTGKVRIGGFIARVVDSKLDTLYVDVDAWLEFKHKFAMAGMILEFDTADYTTPYVGTVSNLVYAGSTGRIIANAEGVKNCKTPTDVDGRTYVAGMLGVNLNANPGTDNVVKLKIDNISMIGVLYTATIASGGFDYDVHMANTNSNNADKYNRGICVDNVTVYVNQYALSKDGLSEQTDNTASAAIGSLATDVRNKDSVMRTDAANTYQKDNYTADYWSTITIANGAGIADPILLPKTVVDMLNA